MSEPILWILAFIQRRLHLVKQIHREILILKHGCPSVPQYPDSDLSSLYVSPILHCVTPFPFTHCGVLLTLHPVFGPYVFLPLIAGFTWFGGILALLGLWVHSGKPRYRSTEASVVFISDVGATYHVSLRVEAAGLPAFPNLLRHYSL